LDDPGIKRKIGRGVAWVGLASSIVAVCDIVALVVILRHWVSAEAFGIVSIVVTLFGALQLAGEMGLPAAVVQRDDPDDGRLSTVYWLGLLFGAGYYAIVFVAAPLVAAAHGRPVLTDLFRTIGLVLLIRPLYTTHFALLRRDLRFRELSTVRMVANVVEFGVKVGTAPVLGLWCFALAPLARELTYAIVIPIRTGWHAKRVWHPGRVGADIRFGLRSTGGEILYQVYSNLDYQVVAAFFGAAATGVYRAAKELVLEPVRFVSNVITIVAFPAFARLRHDRSAVIEQLIAFSRQNLVAVLSLLAVIVVAATDALTVLLGPEYAPAATAARILAVVGTLRSLSHLGPPLLDGLGRPDLSLRYHVTATLVLAAMFVTCAAVGTTPTSVALGWAIGYPAAFVALGWMVLDQIGLTAAQYLRRVWRIPALIAVAAGAGLALDDGLGGAAVGVRFGASAATVVVLGFTLLGVIEGYTPRAMVRSLRE
jgi:O-antigen/teichoic acid export membrane protein